MYSKDQHALITLAGCGGGGSSTPAKKPAVKPAQKPTVFTSKCSQPLGGDKALTFTVIKTVANVEGIACSGSPKAFDDMMKAHPNTKTLNFIDMGGSMNDDANIKLAYQVRAKKLNTYISSVGHVASGGTDLFAAGVKRTIETGALLGVHSWAQGSLQGASLPVGHSQHKPYIDYYKKMGLPDPSGFYWFTLKAAPANGMHYMTPGEVAKYGLATVTTSYSKDLRANYTPKQSILNNDLLDVISDNLKAVSVENHARSNTYTLDYITALLFKQFNVSNRDELITYLKLNGKLDPSAKSYTFKATSDKPKTVYYAAFDLVRASYSSSDKHSIPAKPLIETNMGILDYILKVHTSDVVIELAKNKINATIENDKVSFVKSPTNTQITECKIKTSSIKSLVLVQISNCVESRLKGGDVQFVHFQRTSKTPLSGGTPTISDATVKSSNFEFNAKQSTLVTK
ncbi:COG3904 family protein [Vibrio atlanticus]|uniref:Uncharacterized protein n=1 Tax=Vibrio atlanticus TaxID=693153 RepID=A0A1C3ITI8_9VIBR|nr:hypothetical protein [Vibrio atlanticus]SBS64723.1 hypothetical protein VAT7223_02333 [Vibrio atlanticus]